MPLQRTEVEHLLARHEHDAKFYSRRLRNEKLDATERARCIELRDISKAKVPELREALKGLPASVKPSSGSASLAPKDDDDSHEDGDGDDGDG